MTGEPNFNQDPQKADRKIGRGKALKEIGMWGLGIGSAIVGVGGVAGAAEVAHQSYELTLVELKSRIQAEEIRYREMKTDLESAMKNMSPELKRNAQALMDKQDANIKDSKKLDWSSEFRHGTNEHQNILGGMRLINGELGYVLLSKDRKEGN